MAKKLLSKSNINTGIMIAAVLFIVGSVSSQWSGRVGPFSANAGWGFSS